MYAYLLQFVPSSIAKYMVEINLAEQDQSGQVSQPKLSSLFKAIARANVSAVTAFAVVIFAAASVASITLIANSELAAADSVESYSQTVSPKGQVLGVATYGYQQPVCGKYVCLNYELLGYNNNAWAARVDYNFRNGLRYGSIRVNGKEFAYNLRASGSSYTGYNLQPNVTYTFRFYSGLRGTGSLLATLQFTAPPAPNPEPVPICDYAAPPEGCYYDWSTSDPVTHCGATLRCETPSYGYTAVTVQTPVPGSWREGWIERVNYTPTQVPGTITVSGWAYDQGNSAVPNVYLKNSDTGAVYASAYQNYAGPLRQDVVSYIAGKTGSTPSYQAGSFEVTFTNLPAGSYYIYNAKYNGYLFNIHSQAYQPMTIRSATQPSYGYAGTLGVYNDTSSPYNNSVAAGSKSNTLFGFRLVNTANSGNASSYSYGLTSVTLEANSTQAAQNLSNTYLVDENGTTVAYNSGYLYGSQLTYIFNSTLVLPVGTSRTFKLRADISPYASGTVSFRVTSASYPTGYTLPAYGDGFSSWWSNPITITPAPTEGPRVGQLINKNGTVFLVGNGGLYGIPDIATFNSWGWTFSQVLTANTAELALSQIGTVPSRNPNCNTALEQIAGTCGTTTTVEPRVNISSVYSPSSITAGTSDAEVGRFKISATGEDIKIVGFTTYPPTIYIANCTFTNVRLVDVSTGLQLGQTVPSALNNGGCMVNFSDVTLVVPKDQSKTLALRFTVPSSTPNFSFAMSLVMAYIPPTASGKLVGSSSNFWASTNSINITAQAQPAITQTVNLTANGQQNITAKVGEKINYLWSTTNSVSADSYYSVNKADTCGSVPGVLIPWVANTTNGNNSGIVNSCQVGVTYTITYRAYNPSASPVYALKAITVTVVP
jgi:hypothetical protein